MFLIGVDAFSKWPEVQVMANTTASATLEVLCEWHGISKQVVTDNGTQFTSEAFGMFTKMNGIKHVRSALYHSAYVYQYEWYQARSECSVSFGLKRAGRKICAIIKEFITGYCEQ